MSILTVPDLSVTEIGARPSPVVPVRRTVLGFVATRRVVEVILVAFLRVGSGLLSYGNSFGLHMVTPWLTPRSRPATSATPSCSSIQA